MTKDQNKSIAAELISFSMPLILSGILQQLYSWADAFIVGRAEGELQLGAVGATNSISMFLINTIIGFTLGLSVMGAQEYGRGNTHRIKQIITAFLPILCGVYILLSALGIVFAEPILTIMDTPAEIYGYSLDYLRIVLAGIPFLAVYNLYAAMLRAVGETKLSFYAVLLSSLLNVLLDVLFVVVLPYGVGGAAAATVISQIAMTVYIIISSTSRYQSFTIDKHDWKPDLNTIKTGAAFSVPPTIQNSATAFGNIILQNFMNGFGANTVLAITTAYRVDCLMILPVFNLGAAVSSMVARAKGAKDDYRIKSSLKTGVMMACVVAAVLSLGMYLFGADFIGIFGVTGEALEIGKRFFRDLAYFYVIYGAAMVLRSGLEGIGDITYCSIMGIVTLLTRIGMSYLLRPIFGGRTVALAEGISWCVMLLIMAVRISHKRNELGMTAHKNTES